MKKIFIVTSLFMMISFSLRGQTKVITGVVSDAANGQTIPGVSVTVPNTTIGTVTNFDGFYSLKVPTDTKALKFSYVGMKDIIATIKGTTLNVKMTSETIGVDEVIITATGLKRSEKSLGYSATSVGSEDLTRARDNSLVSGLQGKVAGVQIASNSGSPGASTSVVIRGFSSVSGTNQPLYVIDGVPINNEVSESESQLNSAFDFGNGANAINPDDIETMTVLKGAAATALYGSRAANGVIMIQTKSGGKGKGRGLGILVNSGLTVSRALYLPEYQNRFGQGWDGAHYLSENGSWGPRFDGRVRPWGNTINGKQLEKPYVANEDNVKDFYDDGITWTNSVSFSGGNDVTSYYFSYSNVNSDGIYPTKADSYDRNTFAVRGKHKMDNITISSSLNYSNSENQFVPTGQGLTVINSLTQLPRDISLVDQKDYTNPYYGIDNYFTPYGVTNPYYLLNEYGNEYTEDKVFGKVQLDYDFLDDFKFTYRFGGDVSNSKIKSWHAKTVPAEGSANFDTSTNDPGQLYKERRRIYQVNHDIMLMYNHEFGKDFDLNAIAGFNINERGMSYVTAEIENLDVAGFYDLGNSPSPAKTTDREEKRRLLGLYGQVEGSWKDMLYLTLTMRNDWSSTLPKSDRSFFYPGGTVSFIFSNLFNEDLKRQITFGKFRFAYGQTGNDAAPYLVNQVYTHSSIYQPFRTYDFPVEGNNAYEVSNRLGNNDLRPELTTEMEFGLNMKFFDSRLGFDATYYDRTTEDQIYEVPISSATGYRTQTLNLGEITNKGVELLLTGSPIRTDDFQWDVTLTYTKNKNKVVKLFDGLNKISLGGLSSVGFVAVEGEPLGVFESSVVKRTDNGEIIVGSRGLPLKDSQKQYVGNAQHDYMMGASTSLRYKNWSLNVSFDIRQGGKMFSRTADINYFTGNSIVTAYNDRRPFVIPNSVKEVNGSYFPNDIPVSAASMDSYWINGGSLLDESFVIDRSYVKLRDVVLTYVFPSDLFERTPITGASLSVIGKNLFLWTADSNRFVDPESSTFGNDLESQFGEFSANPTTRSVGFNLKLSF